MDLTMALDLCVFIGKPVRTIFLTTTLSGLHDFKDPVATKDNEFVRSSFLNANIGDGGYVMGP